MELRLQPVQQDGVLEETTYIYIYDVLNNVKEGQTREISLYGKG